MNEMKKAFLAENYADRAKVRPALPGIFNQEATFRKA